MATEKNPETQVEGGWTDVVRRRKAKITKASTTHPLQNTSLQIDRRQMIDAKSPVNKLPDNQDFQKNKTSQTEASPVKESSHPSQLQLHTPQLQRKRNKRKNRKLSSTVTN